jgi:uncharacterized protein
MATLRAVYLGLAASMGVAIPALASNDPTLQLINAHVRAGHLDQAQQMINQVLIDYPHNARAHYVAAELALRSGRLVIARGELNKAERLDPGLPFASPGAVEALKAELGLIRSNDEALALASLAPSFPAVPGVLLAGLGMLVWSIVRRHTGAAH